MSDFAATQHQSETSTQLNFVSCGVLGAVFSRPLWGLQAHVILLEVLLGGLGVVLGCLGVVLGLSGRLLELSWPPLMLSKAVLDLLGAVLGSFGGCLGNKKQ